MSAITKVKNYFVEAYAELRKVTWPTQKQTKNYSLVVIGISLGLAAFFGVLDYIFNIIVGWIV
ncbi:preprotein translocase subunit SecE [Candidatus Nomurabacteria bacterium]|nr:preprotein translocase subunit SecE [Candidatus Nomurabacteria bacterium]